MNISLSKNNKAHEENTEEKISDVQQQVIYIKEQINLEKRKRYCLLFKRKATTFHLFSCQRGVLREPQR